MTVLTKDDIEQLKSWGYDELDIEQIDRAAHASQTKYDIVSCYNCPELDVSKKRAIEVLGRTTWLSGIARSAFHLMAVRHSDDGTKTVLFEAMV